MCMCVWTRIMCQLKWKNQVQYVDKHSAPPPLPVALPTPISGRDLHRHMLFCQEIETVGMLPGQASPPRGPLWVTSIVWPHWSLTGHIVALWDVTHTKAADRFLSHSKWRSFWKAEIWIWGCQRSYWGCMCISDYACGDTIHEKCNFRIDKSGKKVILGMLWKEKNKACNLLRFVFVTYVIYLSDFD